MAAQELAEHALLDALGLRQAVEIEAVLGDARHTEIVQHAADRDHEGVVAETLRRHDLGAAGIVDRLEQDFFRAAIEAGHAAELEGEVMPARVHQIVEAIGSGVQRARGDLVQQRLPDVRQHAVDQRDPRLAAPAEPVAELGREDQAAGTAADDDDVVRHGYAGTARMLDRRAGSRSKLGNRSDRLAGEGGGNRSRIRCNRRGHGSPPRPEFASYIVTPAP